jgi:uncharacterized repeat protein (TIGR03803 family)
MKMKPTSSIGTLGLVLAIALGLWAVSTPCAQAQSFTVIHNFTGGSDGATPFSGFLMVGDYLYGTTSAGGSLAAGSVFKLTTAGEETALHEFGSGTDGAYPQASLIYSKGAFYGTTLSGGASNAGTVFKVTEKGVETVLYSFTGQADGANPVAGLAIDKAGNLYGTTTAGGSSGNGTVFKLAIPSVTGGQWTEQVLYSFGTGTDGTTPIAGVTFDGSGNLYGTTSAGGTYGNGTVFELSPSTGGWTENILHQFELGADGGVPYAGLVLYEGNLYGAATEGGAGGPTGGGTIFELTPSASGWTFSVLYDLSGWGISGTYRNLLVKSGTIYAATHCDGVNTAGTVYELTKSGDTWTYNPLYVFTGGTDGVYSVSNLVADKKGNLYGVTLYGGAYGDGTAYKITP